MSARHFEEALGLVLRALGPLPSVAVPVHEAGGLVPARDLRALVDCPTAAVSARDGYAVRSGDLAGASSGSPVRLRLAGRAAAGEGPSRLPPGCTLRVLTGALLPEGADAVLAGELAREEGEGVLCMEDPGPGSHVLARGSDVAAGALLAVAGLPLPPARAGLLAAGGLASVPVHPCPRVAVVATGDELVPPGAPLAPGRLHASNAVALLAWLARFGMPGRHLLVRDRPEEIRAALEDALAGADAVLTTGGAWMSERDHIAGVLASLGVEPLFRHVRLKPGKATLFGLRGARPIFCLSGGPAACEIGFLQIALPGLLRLAGREPAPFPRGSVRLAEALTGDPHLTRFFPARLEPLGPGLAARPLRSGSRLEAMAAAAALLKVPEGVERLEAGREVEAHFLGSMAPAPAGLEPPGLPPVFCVVGRTGAGKTRLVERLVPALGRLGLRTGTIKHDTHGFELDHPGKDSFRHRRAGAAATLISSPDAIGMVRDAGHDHAIAELRARYLQDVDLILAEGYAREAWPKVEAHKEALGGLLSSPATGLVAVVSGDTPAAGVPVFPWDRVEELAAFLAGRRG